MSRMLVVGNGFDLAHGLPTRYKDMITELQKQFTLPKSASKWLSAEDIDRFYFNPFIKYFTQSKSGSNWTDFETDIREIVNYFSLGRSGSPFNANINSCFQTFSRPLKVVKHSSNGPNCKNISMNWLNISTYIWVYTFRRCTSPKIILQTRSSPISSINRNMITSVIQLYQYILRYRRNLG